MKRLLKTEKELSGMLSLGLFDSYILLVKYGEDEWQLNTPNVNLDTYFDAASVGKIFPTATLALMAIDRGLLSLEDTLEKFFPNVPCDKKDITVKQLLTHTSGIIRKEFKDGVADRGRDSIIDFVFETPLAYQPGTYYAYSCSGMLMMGFIVEKVFGMPLDVAMQELLSKPLGLTRSKYNIDKDEPNAVCCHFNPEIFDCRLYDNNVSKMGGIPAGNGENYVTAGDLKKFALALINKDSRLYSEETFRLAEQNYTKDVEVLESQAGRSTENHGLGFVYVDEDCIQARELFPEGAIGHTGWTGQSIYLSRDPDMYAILLTNAMRGVRKLTGKCDEHRIWQMRADIHRAIKEDLGL